jgi:hypothetical protein
VNVDKHQHACTVNVDVEHAYANDICMWLLRMINMHTNRMSYWYSRACMSESFDERIIWMSDVPIHQSNIKQNKNMLIHMGAYID